jgi:glutamyl-tRNA synthetase
LLAAGAAYRDFATADEIQAEREAAERDKRPFVYSRRWMAETAEEARKFEAQGRSSVVRLKIPRQGSVTIRDLVRGEVTFPWDREQDHVIQRADGSCLYHLATVIDDHDFEITHVIRAEEHLSNTPRQVFIAQSLGYALPEFAHVPYVAEPGSKTKLSKRKLDKYLKNRDFARLNELGQKVARRIDLPIAADTFNPVIVDFYQQVGFLPEAIVNYLLLLGWSLDDKTEFFSRDEMIASFSLDRVNKAPASFDPQKLLSFQQHYMNSFPIEQKTQQCASFLKKAGLDPGSVPAAGGLDYLRRICRAAGDRIVVAGDILEFDDFFRADAELAYDSKAFQKRLIDDPTAVDLLRQFRAELAECPAFEAESLEHQLKEFVGRKKIKINEIIHALRVAVTGKEVGFGMFETLEILGRERSLARIDHALGRIR